MKNVVFFSIQLQDAISRYVHSEALPYLFQP
jgi:hypothetical protein